MIKTVAVWGDLDLPKGYVSIGILILDARRDLFFTVGAPHFWIATASQMDLARALGETVQRELEAYATLHK